MKGWKVIMVMLFVVTLIAFISVKVNAEVQTLGTFKQGNMIELSQIDNATYCNISSVSYPNSSYILKNLAMTKSGTRFNYSLSSVYTNELGEYIVNGECNSVVWTYDFYVTPTGKQIDNAGNISIGILFFLGFISIVFISFGYLLLNGNPFVKYLGIFLICLGFVFLYWGLHLSNVYATTISYNAGAGNTTTGMFKMISGFLKIVPYIVSLIIVLVILKIYRINKSKKDNDDGWNEGQY